MKLILQNKHDVTLSISKVSVAIHRNVSATHCDYILQFFATHQKYPDGTERELTEEIHLESAIVENKPFELYVALRLSNNNPQALEQLSQALNQHQSAFFGTLEGIDLTLLEVIPV